MFHGFKEVEERIRKELEAGKSIVQILSTGAKHFVTACYQKGNKDVVVYDSLGMPVTKQLGQQLARLFGQKGSVKIRKIKVQMQERGSNNCGFFAAAYMADICFGNTVEGAVYVRCEAQRAWFASVITTGILKPCPRLENKPARFYETSPYEASFSG